MKLIDGFKVGDTILIRDIIFVSKPVFIIDYIKGGRYKQPDTMTVAGDCYSFKLTSNESDISRKTSYYLKYEGEYFYCPRNGAKYVTMAKMLLTERVKLIKRGEHFLDII